MNGIGIETFRKGNDAFIITPDNIVDKIFHSYIKEESVSTEEMDFDAFVKTMNMVAARSLQAKIDLFMEVINNNY